MPPFRCRYKITRKTTTKPIFLSVAADMLISGSGSSAGAADIALALGVEKLKDTGFAGWVCTELDAWPDPAEGARLSMDYLKRAIAG